MRSTISAQSCASVPPAPALTLTSASPRVVAAREQALLLERRPGAARPRRDARRPPPAARRPRRPSRQARRDPRRRLQRGERLQAPRRPRVLGRHRRGCSASSQKPGAPSGLERRDALAQPSRVKDSPRAASAARGSPQALRVDSLGRRSPWPHAISGRRPESGTFVQTRTRTHRRRVRCRHSCHASRCHNPEAPRRFVVHEHARADPAGCRARGRRKGYQATCGLAARHRDRSFQSTSPARRKPSLSGVEAGVDRVMRFARSLRGSPSWPTPSGRHARLAEWADTSGSLAPDRRALPSVLGTELAHR